MRIVSRETLISECKTEDEILEWHQIHDCSCGIINSEDGFMAEFHKNSCPLNDPLDEAWLYIL